MMPENYITLTGTFLAKPLYAANAVILVEFCVHGCRNSVNPSILGDRYFYHDSIFLDIQVSAMKRPNFGEVLIRVFRLLIRVQISTYIFRLPQGPPLGRTNCAYIEMY
jgi:hypothetical protein